jgi:hypothetical protein
LATLREADVSYTEIILIVVSVHRNLPPASGDFGDVSQKVSNSMDLCRSKQNEGDLSEEHLGKLFTTFNCKTGKTNILELQTRR